VSCISEATKCLRRGEPVYASHLAKRVVETLLRVEDRGHDRPPIGLSRVDTRASEGLLDLAASLAGAVDPPSVARSVGVASGAVRSAIVAVHDMGDIDERLRDALLAGLTLSEAL
jgi:hypothetical protein